MKLSNVIDIRKKLHDLVNGYDHSDYESYYANVLAGKLLLHANKDAMDEEFDNYSIDDKDKLLKGLFYRNDILHIKIGKAHAILEYLGNDRYSLSISGERVIISRTDREPLYSIIDFVGTIIISLYC